MDARNLGFGLATIRDRILIRRMMPSSLWDARYRQTLGQNQHATCRAKGASYEDIVNKARSRHRLVSRASQERNAKSLSPNRVGSLFQHIEHTRDADPTSKSSSA